MLAVLKQNYLPSLYCFKKVLYLPVPPYGSDGFPIRDPYPSSGALIPAGRLRQRTFLVYLGMSKYLILNIQVYGILIDLTKNAYCVVGKKNALLWQCYL
jgi:hypothetical protein